MDTSFAKLFDCPDAPHTELLPRLSAWTPTPKKGPTQVHSFPSNPFFYNRISELLPASGSPESLRGNKLISFDAKSRKAMLRRLDAAITDADLGSVAAAEVTACILENLHFSYNIRSSVTQLNQWVTKSTLQTVVAALAIDVKSATASSETTPTRYLQAICQAKSAGSRLLLAILNHSTPNETDDKARIHVYRLVAEVAYEQVLTTIADVTAGPSLYQTRTICFAIQETINSTLADWSINADTLTRMAYSYTSALTKTGALGNQMDILELLIDNVVRFKDNDEKATTMEKVWTPELYALYRELFPNDDDPLDDFDVAAVTFLTALNKHFGMITLTSAERVLAYRLSNHPDSVSDKYTVPPPTRLVKAGLGVSIALACDRTAITFAAEPFQNGELEWIGIGPDDIKSTKWNEDRTTLTLELTRSASESEIPGLKRGVSAIDVDFVDCVPNSCTFPPDQLKGDTKCEKEHSMVRKRLRVQVSTPIELNLTAPGTSTPKSECTPPQRQNREQSTPIQRFTPLQIIHTPTRVSPRIDELESGRRPVGKPTSSITTVLEEEKVTWSSIDSDSDDFEPHSAVKPKVQRKQNTPGSRKQRQFKADEHCQQTGSDDESVQPDLVAQVKKGQKIAAATNLQQTSARSSYSKTKHGQSKINSQSDESQSGVSIGKKIESVERNERKGAFRHTRKSPRQADSNDKSSHNAWDLQVKKAKKNAALRPQVMMGSTAQKSSNRYSKSFSASDESDSDSLITENCKQPKLQSNRHQVNSKPVSLKSRKLHKQLREKGGLTTGPESGSVLKGCQGKEGQSKDFSKVAISMSTDGSESSAESSADDNVADAPRWIENVIATSTKANQISSHEVVETAKLSGVARKQIPVVLDTQDEKRNSRRISRKHKARDTSPATLDRDDWNTLAQKFASLAANNAAVFHRDLTAMFEDCARMVFKMVSHVSLKHATEFEALLQAQEDQQMQCLDQLRKIATKLSECDHRTSKLIELSEEHAATISEIEVETHTLCDEGADDLEGWGEFSQRQGDYVAQQNKAIQQALHSMLQRLADSESRSRKKLKKQTQAHEQALRLATYNI